MRGAGIGENLGRDRGEGWEVAIIKICNIHV